MNAHVDIRIVDGPLGPASADATASDAVGAEAGAVIAFEGVVRPTEDTRPIAALDYEAYEPMAGRTLRALAEAVAAGHGLLAVVVEHSRGRVPVGRCSFRLVVWSRHRKEGLAAMDEFIDRMKQDVPIWKTAVYAADSGGAGA